MFDGSDSYELTGLGRGGEQINKVKKVYEEVVRLLVEIARFFNFSVFFLFSWFLVFKHLSPLWMR